MYKNKYMPCDPLIEWSTENYSERAPIPPQLKRFIENYYDEALEFGFDAHEYGENMLDQIRDTRPDLDDNELANLLIAESF